MPALIEWETVRPLVRNAVDLDRAPIGGVDAAQYFHQGGFARAILTDKADHLAAMHIGGKIRERHDAGVGFRNPG